MKTRVLFIVAAAMLASCQQGPKQYSESGPEVELARKNLETYLKQDWVGYASTFADTARIYNNSWDPARAQSVTQWVEGSKGFRVLMPDIKIGEQFHSYIMEDDGEQWVLSWFEWTGTTTDGKSATIPIHISSQVAGGKIVLQELFYDYYPASLIMPADTTANP
jgi:hypothetical protein